MSFLPDSRPNYPQRRPKSAQARIPRNQVHAIIGGAKAHFEAGRPVDDGAYLRPYTKLLVDLTTSKACLEKTLAFANGLFNALNLTAIA
ncbi:hypothetical protein [Mesorhizobium sp. M0772]|uniref:hypothetical protein n=1 Tax=Mesorhizobium sp. M0772 TaxID=2956998 RepID=UPI00333D91C0